MRGTHEEEGGGVAEDGSPLRASVRSSDGPSPGRDAALVEGRGLVRTYHRGKVPVHALRGVDLAVAPGEFVVIVGTSGGGKSTLLNLLGGLDRPDAGTLRVADVDLTAATERDLDRFRREHVGYVLQFFNLLGTASARDNVALGLVAAGHGWTPARETATGLLESVGLGQRGDHRPAELSGGEQQRVAIARAIAGEPALVLADEPTGELDTDTGRSVMELMLDLNRRLSTTFVVASHDDRVADYADRVLRLRDGRLEG